MRLFSARLISPTDPRVAPESWVGDDVLVPSLGSPSGGHADNSYFGATGDGERCIMMGIWSQFSPRALSSSPSHVVNQASIEAWWQHWHRLQGRKWHEGSRHKKLYSQDISWDPDTQIVTHWHQEGDDLSSHHRGWSRVCHARKQIFQLRNSEIQTRKNVRKKQSRKTEWYLTQP